MKFVFTGALLLISTALPSPWFFDSIAFDAKATGGSSGTSPLVWSHTVTGSNPILWVEAYSSGGDFLTGCTYNSVSMTQAIKSANAVGGDQIYLYYLAGPATGTHSVSCSFSAGTLYGDSASYTGAKQTGIPDASNSGTNAGGAVSFTLTTVANNAWIVAGAENNSTASLCNTSCTNIAVRQTNSSFGGIGLLDSNAAITPAGGTTVGIHDGASALVLIAASFAPNVGGGAAFPNGIKNFPILCCRRPQ